MQSVVSDACLVLGEQSKVTEKKFKQKEVKDWTRLDTRTTRVIEGQVRVITVRRGEREGLTEAIIVCRLQTAKIKEGSRIFHTQIHGGKVFTAVKKEAVGGGKQGHQETKSLQEDFKGTKWR